MAELSRGEKGYLYEWDVEARQVSQAAADYDPYGAKDGKGCASCQWFVPTKDACVLVRGDIVATGNSRFYTAPVVEDVPPLLVKLVDSKSLTRKEQSEGGEEPSNGLGLLSRFKGYWKDLWGLDPDNKAADNKPFWVFRTKSGDLRFLVVYSNIFKDQHQEIISTKAHKEYVDWVTKSGHYPELQIWHCGPGSSIGRGDFVDFVDGFAIGGGIIFKEHEAKAEALAAQDTGVSQGFLGISGVEGDNVYSLYRPWEWTLLPATKAANEWTDYKLGLKELLMPFAPEKRTYLLGLGYTEKDLGEMEAKLANFTSALQSQGVQFKAAEGTEQQPQQPQQPTQNPPTQNPPTPTPAPQQPTPQPQQQPAPQPANDPAQAHIKELTDRLGQQGELLLQMGTMLKSLDGQLKQLQKPIEDQVADVLTARIENSPGNAGFVASASQKNLENSGKAAVPGAAENPDFNWFFQEVVHPLNPAAVAAAQAAANTNGQRPIPTGAN